MKREIIEGYLISFGQSLIELDNGNSFSIRSMLANGNIEITLKTLLLCHIEKKSSAIDYAFCMDKYFSFHQIDAVGFIGQNICHTFEVKCSLLCDLPDSTKAAENAISQAILNKTAYPIETRTRSSQQNYIIHFLIDWNMEGARHLPDTVSEKFKTRSNPNETLNFLLTMYGAIDRGLHNRVEIIKNRLSAILVNIE